MANTHDCITNNCSGTRYDGANFTCNRCLKPSYVECNINRKEVTNLIQIINNSKTLNENRLNNILKSIINQESVFEFTCQTCKTMGSYTDSMKEQIEKEKKQYEKLNTKYKNKIKELEEETKIQKQRINEIETINAQIINKQINSEEDNMEIEDEQNQLETSNKITDICKIMEKKLINLKTEMETKIKIETDKIMDVLSANNIIMEESERKRRKIITQKDRQIPSTSNENTHQNLLNINLRDINKNKNINKLKPPNEEYKTKKGLYEIYISKFDKRTTEKDIEEHIKENTNIKNSDTFKIEKIISKKEENKDKYVSFKIITLKTEIYTEIIDENLWAPDFKARDYMQDFKETIKNNYTRERKPQAKRYNNYYERYTTRPIRTKYDMIQTRPTKTFKINRNWDRNWDRNTDTPRATKRYGEYNTEGVYMRMHGTKNQYNQNNRNYDNNRGNTPYLTKRQNFRYAPTTLNTTPRQNQTQDTEQQQHQN